MKILMRKENWMKAVFVLGIAVLFMAASTMSAHAYKVLELGTKYQNNCAADGDDLYANIEIMDDSGNVTIDYDGPGGIQAARDGGGLIGTDSGYMTFWAYSGAVFTAVETGLSGTLYVTENYGTYLLQIEYATPPTYIAGPNQIIPVLSVSVTGGTLAAQYSHIIYAALTYSDGSVMLIEDLHDGSSYSYNPADDYKIAFYADEAPPPPASGAPELPMGAMQLMTVVFGGLLVRIRRLFC